MKAQSGTYLFVATSCAGNFIFVPFRAAPIFYRMNTLVFPYRERLQGTNHYIGLHFRSRTIFLFNFAILQKYSLTANGSPKGCSFAFLTIHIVQNSFSGH